MKNNNVGAEASGNNSAVDNELFICKFQRPIFDSAPEDEDTLVLVYDESREMMGQFPISKEEMEVIFPDGALKTYWLCDKDEGDKGMVYPIEQVEEQDW